MLRVEGRDASEPARRIVGRGALGSVLDPKLSIFFLALLPPFHSRNLATATAEMIALGAVFPALTLAVFVLGGVFAAAARTGVQQGERAMRWLGRAFAAAFGGPALRPALERA